MMSEPGQKPYLSDIYYRIPRNQEQQQGYNMRESEQLNLGIRNQAEGMSKNEVHFEDPSSHNTGLIYAPSNTYKDVKTPMWVSKSENKQTTLGIIDNLNNRKKSTVVYAKQETHDAPQIALSNHLELPDYDHAYR